jgi:hypothetical protein
LINSVVGQPLGGVRSGLLIFSKFMCLFSPTRTTRFYHNALEATQAHVKGSKADIGGSRQDRNPESEDEELLEELTKAKESYADSWEKNQKDELATQKVSGT